LFTSTTYNPSTNNKYSINLIHFNSKALPSNTQITHTTTLTTTTTSAANCLDPTFDTDLICNPVRLSAFMDLDRLVLELSSLGQPSNTAAQPTPSTTTNNTGEICLTPALNPFTDEHCNYLLGQFESFAKDFKKKEASSSFSSRASTVERRTGQESHKSGRRRTGATVYSNTAFKHITDRRLSVKEEIQNGEETTDNSEIPNLISKFVDYKNTEKVNFKETNILLNDIDANQLLSSVLEMSSKDLNNNTTKTSVTTDPVKTFTSLFDDPDAALLCTASASKRPPFKVHGQCE